MTSRSLIIFLWVDNRFKALTSRDEFVGYDVIAKEMKAKNRA